MMLTTLRAQFLPALARAQLPPAAFFATGTSESLNHSFPRIKAYIWGRFICQRGR